MTSTKILKKNCKKSSTNIMYKSSKKAYSFQTKWNLDIIHFNHHESNIQKSKFPLDIKKSSKKYNTIEKQLKYKS